MRALLPLCLLAGCAPNLADDGRFTRVDPLPLRAIEPSGPARTVPVTVSATAAVRALGAAPVAVDSLRPDQMSELGLPLFGVPPFARSPLGECCDASVDALVPLPEGGTLVAWMDLNRDGVLNVGDRFSPPGDASLTIERIYVEAAAEGPKDEVAVTVQLPESFGGADGRLLLLGFSERGGRPPFEWRSEGKRRSWPESFTVALPRSQPLRYLAVLDRDGDDRPGPEDLAGPPAYPRDGALALTLTGPFDGPGAPPAAGDR